jgi:hypothetical protein
MAWVRYDSPRATPKQVDLLRIIEEPLCGTNTSWFGSSSVQQGQGAQQCVMLVTLKVLRSVHEWQSLLSCQLPDTWISEMEIQTAEHITQEWYDIKETSVVLHDGDSFGCSPVSMWWPEL